MQINTKRIGMIEALGQDFTTITPDGCTDPTWDLGEISVSFVAGTPHVILRTNCRGDSAANIVGMEAIRFVHEAFSEVLKRIDSAKKS